MNGRQVFLEDSSFAHLCTFICSVVASDDDANPLDFLASFRWQVVLGATAEIQI